MNLKYVFLALFIISTHLSSFISISLYKLTKSPVFFQLPLVNDLLLITLAFLSILNGRVSILSKKAFLLLILIIGFLFIDFMLVSNADFFFKALALRKILSLFIALMVGLNYFDNVDIKKYLRFHHIIFLPVFLFGIFEYSIDTAFWDNVMELPKFWRDKGDIFEGRKDTVETSGKFYSYDLYFLIQRKVRRIVSFYAETKPLASYCMFLYPFVFFSSKNQKRFLFLFMILLVGLLTYSKGFILVVLVCFLQLFVKLKPGILWVMLLIFFFLGSLVNRYGIGFGPLSHLNGLYTGAMVVVNGNPIGVGLGSSGNYVSELQESLGGGESGLGAMFSQIGIIALIFYYFLYLLASQLYRKYLASSDVIYYAAFVCLVGWCGNFLYSEAALGFRGNIFVFLTIGLILSIPNTKKNDNKLGYLY